jgi:hypothetical protein
MISLVFGATLLHLGKKIVRGNLLINTEMSLTIIVSFIIL